jgi:hypothetical protein
MSPVDPANGSERWHEVRIVMERRALNQDWTVREAIDVRAIQRSKTMSRTKVTVV